MKTLSALRSPMLALAVAVAVSGCANYRGIGSDSHLLDADHLAAGHSLQAETGSWPTEQWWRSFGDAQLDSLITEALAHSPELAIAAARVRLADAELQNSRAVLLPSLGLSADVTSQHYSENSLYPAPLGGSFRSSGDIMLQAQYDLDFWGRNRDLIAAGRSRSAAARAEAASARLLLASGVARTYFQLAQWQRYHAIATSALQQRERIYALTRDRVRAGLDTRVQLKQAETQVPLMRTAIAQVDANIINIRHALAALLGAGPDRTLNLTAHLPQLPARITAQAPQNLPVELLGHRPDIVAARWRVEAANRTADAGKAAFYPNINLAAFAGYSSIGLDKLTQWSSRTYGGGPALSLPIFDNDRLRSGLKADYAAYDSAVANYNQTLIEALRDVADQLNNYRSLQPQITQQQLALDAAQEAYDLALERYHAGLGNYLTVLNAESAVLQQRLFHAQLHAQALTVRIELARALGGGYPAAKLQPASGTSQTTAGTATLARAARTGEHHE